MRRFFARPVTRRVMAFSAGLVLLFGGCVLSQKLGNAGVPGGKNLGEFASLAMGVTAMALLLPRGKRVEGRFVALSLTAGAVGSAALLALLVAFGSIRFPHARTFSAWDMGKTLLTEAAFALYAAMLLRAALLSAVPAAGAGRFARPAVSALSEAGLFLLICGGWNLTSAVNGLLTGLLFGAVYERAQNPLPEAAAAFAFRVVSRLGFGFPDLGGAYPVSEAWLTGEAALGLEGSGIFMIFLTIVFLFIAVFRKKFSFRK